MSKGSRRVMGALFAAVLALVLVVCILCATFARYTTSSTGDSGAVSVELWDVRAESQGTVNAPVKTTSLRPLNGDYSSKKQRDNQSDPVRIMTFVNNGSLDADVTLDYERTLYTAFDLGYSDSGYVDAAEVNFDWDENFQDEDYDGWGKGWKEDDGTNAYMKNTMEKLDEWFEENGYDTGLAGFVECVNCMTVGNGMFELDFYYEADDSDDETKWAKDKDEENYLYSESGKHLIDMKVDHSYSKRGATGNSFVLGPGDSETVYVTITWYSLYEAGENYGTQSDAIDTIIGMYAKAIIFQIEWEAVQAS